MAHNTLHRNHQIYKIHRTHSTLSVYNENRLISPCKPSVCTNSTTHHRADISHIIDFLELGNKNRSAELIVFFSLPTLLHPTTQDASHLMQNTFQYKEEKNLNQEGKKYYYCLYVPLLVLWFCLQSSFIKFCCFPSTTLNINRDDKFYWNYFAKL